MSGKPFEYNDYFIFILYIPISHRTYARCNDDADVK